MTSEIFWLMKSTNIYVPVSLTGKDYFYYFGSHIHILYLGAWQLPNVLHPIINRKYAYWPIWMGKLFIFLCNKKGLINLARALGLTEIYSKMAGIDVRYWHQTSEIPWSWTPVLWNQLILHWWLLLIPVLARLYILGHTAQIIRSRKLCLTIIRNEWEVGMLMQHYTGPLGAL